MPENQHIRVVEDCNRISLVCDDYELFDWMTDLFVEEHDVDVEGVIFKESSSKGKAEYRINFPQSIKLEFVREVVDGLDKAEIERVYLLNNTYDD